MTTNDSPVLAVGCALGHFVVRGVLGAGGMGEVYEAEDTRLRRRVALKVVRRDLAVDATRRALLAREARAAAGLNHPNIVTVYSLEEHDGQLLIAMELVEGTTLASALPSRGLTEARLVRLSIQLADAFAAAHRLGIVHGDVKPANVMLTSDDVAKVVDFGISTLALDQRGEGASTTIDLLVAESTVKGTPAYMAPERIEGHPASPQTDLFSLGVMLFELATGRRPFDGPTPLAVVTSILRDEAPLATDINPAVSPSVSRLISRCLNKDPQRRTQSATDLLAELQDLARTSASGPGSALRGRVRRNSIWAAGATLALGAAGLLWAGGLAGIPGSGGAAARPAESLAVLPLEDLSRSAEPYFVDGLTDALITGVGRIEGVRVVPRSAVMGFQSAARPSVEIARELGVDAVVEGSVVRSGDRVRINVHLIQVATNRTVWSNSYDRDLGDVFQLQRDVALAIADELGVTLTAGDRAAFVAGSRRVVPAAFDQYLRGITLMERVNRADIDAAIQALERAVDLDPGFADAFGALAIAYSYKRAAYGAAEPEQLDDLAAAAIDTAFSLDPQSVDANVARGALIWNADHGWPHEESARAYRAALAINPTADLARRRLSTVYNHIGLADAALGELAQAGDSPAVLFQKGLAHRMKGRLDLALASWMAIPAPVRNSHHVGHLVWVLADLGRTEEAWRLVRDAGTAAGPDVNGVLAAATALLYAIGQDVRRADEQAAVALRQAGVAPESHHATYLVASTYARLGRVDEALQWLRYTAADGFPCYPLIAGDRNLDVLRPNAAFSEFLEESRIRWEGYRARLGG